jgi:hypothetical protein
LCNPGNQSHHAAIESPHLRQSRAKTMNAIIYLVGLVVIVLAILSFLGLR